MFITHFSVVLVYEHISEQIAKLSYFESRINEQHMSRYIAQCNH